MTEQLLPFDGGASPEPPDTPRPGDLVTVKDDDHVGDAVGRVLNSTDNDGVTRYFVGWYDDDGLMWHIGKYLQEEMEYVGREAQS
jgi:hypothetical protein